MWTWAGLAHPGSRWLSPLQKDYHNCCTGDQELQGGRGTAHCGVHMNAKWSPRGSNHMAGRNHCPGVGSEIPVQEWVRVLRSEVRV